MDDWQYAAPALGLALACAVAGIAGRRGANARRDVRLMLGTGAALGGLALLLLALQDIT